MGGLTLVTAVFVACTPSPAPSSPSGVASGAPGGASDGDVRNATSVGRSANLGEHPAQGPNSTLIAARFEAMFTTADGSRREGALPRGAELHSGDWLWVSIDVSRRSHIYVLQLDPDGQPELLFPSALERDDARPAGASLRVPPLPEVFTLDSRVGTEHLVVIASVLPIATTDADLRNVLEAAQARSKLGSETAAPAAPVHPSSAPSGATRARESSPRPVRPSDGYLSRVADRGILRVNPGAAIEAREDSDGIAIICFDFEHR